MVRALRPQDPPRVVAARPSKALRLLALWAFTELGARRLELLINVENETSKVVATRCGYTKEGVLRGTYFKPGLWTDTEIWSPSPPTHNWPWSCCRQAHDAAAEP